MRTDQMILELMAPGPMSSTELARAIGVTRQAVHQHLQRLLHDGAIRRIGPPRGPGARYERTSLLKLERQLAGLEEHEVWTELAGADPIRRLPASVQTVHQYVFTEMLNNAIDHSDSPAARVEVRHLDGSTSVTITDHGIGVFARISEHLPDVATPEIIAELTKGKLTTDPARHTGEGIFFSSRIVDAFTLAANGWQWIVDNELPDWSMAASPVTRGTQVTWRLADTSTKQLNDVFERFTEDHAFTTTATRIELFDYGTTLISRSEGRRLTNRLNEFTRVVLDFADVEQVGQGFADEVFRVWATEHPDVRVEAVNMNPAVTFMVERARH